MRRTSRLFEIIQPLRSARKPLTAAALAETLEVTKRTVYRDRHGLAAPAIGAASTVAPTPRASGCPMPRWPPLIFSLPHFTATGTTPSGHDSPQTDAVVRAQALRARPRTIESSD